MRREALIALAALALAGAAAAGPRPPTPEARGGQERAAMEELAELYVQEGRTDDALALFAELRGLEPGEAKWWRRPAEVLEASPERGADLLALLTAWRAAMPALREPSERLVRFYEQDGAIDEGLAVLEPLIVKEPRDVSLRRAKAELLETGDRVPAAIGAWSAVLALPGATVEDRWRRAELMSTQGDSPALRAEYEALVAAGPRDPRFRVGLGEACLAANDLPCAEAQVAAAAEAAPEDADVKKLAAALEAAKAEVTQDTRDEVTERRDFLRRQWDRAERLRGLRPVEDY